MINLIIGNNLETLKQLPDNSVDSIVTDPPYGLSFMGKKWDYDVPTTELWQECFRVLKHGGHLLAFFGTRTYHRGVVRIEDAGFEIRDQIQWIYGSGFPKSHNIGKAIDKAAGAEREVVGLNPNHRGESQMKNQFTKSLGQNGSITAPKTDLAKQWDGWGTALKPANEPIVVARKPLEKGLTIAENVLKYRTGAINIDECRIAMSKDDPNLRLNSPNHEFKKDESGFSLHSGNGTRATQDLGFHNSQGRWPANVILDETAAEMLDEQSGNIRSRNGYGVKGQTGGGTGSSYVMRATTAEVSQKVVREDQNGYLGGASRFFYVAKASKSERNKGLEGLPLREIYPQNNSSERKEINSTANARVQNHHPTVKPIKLMQYLIKLVTPPNGTVLDPFMGSGSTGVAAKELGFNFVGCELSPEYFEIAEKRIEALND